MKFRRPRGTSDIFGERMELWRALEETLSGLLRSYGYREIRTPIFEMTDLFVRTVGEGTDIVTKEMYTFLDKKGRSLTLRPENTAPVMRAFLENGLHRKGGIARFYYLGPMFRYDRPQTGRYRQFHQIGAEAIGSLNPSVDAEIIEVSLNIYRILGFPPLDVKLNSVGCPVCRPRFKEVLTKALTDRKNELCDNCTERVVINPLRIFDCKECGDIKAGLPVITDHLCEECKHHFNALQGILHDIEVDFTFDPLLVRGLDYYTKTAFEIVHPKLGAQNALCGGGRYDGLAEDCGGGHIPAVGFSAGMERLIETLPQDSAVRRRGGAVDIYFIPIADAGQAQALVLASGLRAAGFTALVDLSGRNMKKQLKAASELETSFTVFIGTEELERGAAAVKNMGTGFQESVPFDGIVEFMKKERETGSE